MTAAVGNEQVAAAAALSQERGRLRDRAVTLLQESAYSAQELRRLVQEAAA